MTEETVRRLLQVLDPIGLHIRPAAAIAQAAAAYEGTVRLRFGEREADAKSVLDLLTLGAVPGATVELIVNGEDAEQAAERICRVWDEVMRQAKEQERTEEP